MLLGSLLGSLKSMGKCIERLSMPSQHSQGQLNEVLSAGLCHSTAAADQKQRSLTAMVTNSGIAPARLHALSRVLQPHQVLLAHPGAGLQHHTFTAIKTWLLMLHLVHGRWLGP
jgi:hypothetical protein